MAKSKRKNIDGVTFVRTFQESESYEEVAEKLGLEKGSVISRAMQYRKKGVNLKRFASKRGAPPLDVDALNALIGG